MRTLLINLDRSPERLASIRPQIEAAGLGFERVPAVDGSKLGGAALEVHDRERAVRHFGRPLTTGEIGCYLSHVECARRFVASGEPSCLVLEDDAVPADDAGAFVKALADWLDNESGLDWDIVNLGKQPKRMHTKRTVLAGRAVYSAHYYPTGTAALLWSRRGATAFLKAHGRISAPIDHYLRSWCCRRDGGVAVAPRPFVPRGAGSTIDAVPGERTAFAHNHRLGWALRHVAGEFRRQGANYVNAWRHQRAAQKHPPAG